MTSLIADIYGFFNVSGNVPVHVQTDIMQLTANTSMPILPATVLESSLRGYHPVFSAANLVLMRKMRNFSQEEVARRSGLATVTISKLEERRSKDPKVSTVSKLAKALDCPIETFFSEEATRPGTEGRE